MLAAYITIGQKKLGYNKTILPVPRTVLYPTSTITSGTISISQIMCVGIRLFIIEAKPKIGKFGS